VAREGIAFAIVYGGALSFVILMIVDALVGLYCSYGEEGQRLDLTPYSEQVYHMEF